MEMNRLLGCTLENSQGFYAKKKTNPRNWGPRGTKRVLYPFPQLLLASISASLQAAWMSLTNLVSISLLQSPLAPLMAGVSHCLNQQDTLDTRPEPSDTNGFGFRSRSHSQWELHSCCAGSGCLSGKLVFDGAGTAPFPLSTIIQTLLSAGALTSPSLMSSYRYVSHISIFPSGPSSSCNPSTHPPLSSHSHSRTQESLQRGWPSHLGLRNDENPLTQESGDKVPSQGTWNKTLHLPGPFLLIIQMGLIMLVLPTSQGYYKDQMRLKVSKCFEKLKALLD